MVEIDKNACIGCGKCAADCFAMCLRIKAGKAEFDGTQGCILCGHCVAICPQKAVSIPEFDMADVRDAASLKPCPSIETVLDVIRGRRSIRRFKPDKIEKEKIKNLLEAGRYTATARNRQYNRFIIVQDKLPELKDRVYASMREALDKGGGKEAEPIRRFIDLRDAGVADYIFRDAPAVIYVTTDRDWDGGLAAQNMEFAALAQGLGFLYNGYLARFTALSKDTLRWLHIDRPVSACMLAGYPAVTYERTAPRKPVDAVLM